MEGVIDQWFEADDPPPPAGTVDYGARGYHKAGAYTSRYFRGLPTIESQSLRASESGTLCLSCLLLKQCSCKKRRGVNVHQSRLAPSAARDTLATIRWLDLADAAVIDMNRLGSANKFTAKGESAVGSNKPVAMRLYHKVIHNTLIMPKLRKKTTFTASRMTERQVYEVYSNFFTYLHILISSLEPYPTMVQMCNTIVRLVVPLLIPAPDYSAHMPYINTLVDIGVPPINCVINTSRQVGKTTVTGAVLSAFIAAVVRPDQETVINVVAQKTSMETEILSMIKGNVKKLAMAARTSECPTPPEIRDDNSTTFSVVRDGMVLSIRCLAPTDGGLRGTSADIIWIDELFFLNPPRLVDMVATVASTAGHHVVGTTTPNADRVDTQLYKVAIGEPIPSWTGRDLGLVCLSCQQNNVNTHCTHRLFFLPPWKTFTELIASAKTATLRIELYGISCRRMTDIVFKPEETQFSIWPENQYSCIDPYYNMVFVSMDPGAGSRRSANAFVAAMYDRTTNSAIVLGLDNVVAEHSSTSDLTSLLKEFLQRVYALIHLRMPHLRGTIRVMPLLEGNHNTFLVRDALGIFIQSVDAASHMNLKLVYPPIELLSTSTTPGDMSVGSAFRLCTTRLMKYDAMLNLQELFMRKKVFSVENLHIATTGIQEILTSSHRGQLVSTVSRTSRPDAYGAELKDLMREQLLAFRLTPSGALSGKSNQTRDDLAMAMFINVYWFAALSILGAKQPQSMERLLTGKGYARGEAPSDDDFTPFTSNIDLA